MISIIAAGIATSFAIGAVIASTNLYKGLVKAEADIAEARDLAANFKARLSAQSEIIAKLRGSVERAREDLNFVTIERDNARAELDRIAQKRSDIVSRGNRTRALRRRGALVPAPVNDLSAIRDLTA